MFKMNKIKNIILLLVAGVTTTYSADINLSGTVFDDDDQPLKGVVVSLVITGLNDTTDVDGKWNILSDVAANRSIESFSNMRYALNENVLSIDLENSAFVQ